MLNNLLLISGNDIPFEEAQVIIHPPTLKEIAFIGEDNFYIGCEFLTFSKNRLSLADKEFHKDKTDLMVFIMLMKEPKMRDTAIAAEMVLTLLFPRYSISFEWDRIVLKEQELIHSINSKNFDTFKQILSTIFCLKTAGIKEDYNPAGSLAQKIADKFNKRKQKLAELKQNSNESSKSISILSRYISILTTGMQKDINSYMNYTIYQLFDEFKRFELKMRYDMHVKAQLAGAKDLPEVEDWTKDLYNEDTSELYK